MQEAFLARYPDAEHVGNGWFEVDTAGLLFRANFEDGCTLQSGDVVEHAATFERAHVLLLRALRKALNKQFKALKIALPPPPQSPWEPPDTPLVFVELRGCWVACVPNGQASFAQQGAQWVCCLQGATYIRAVARTPQRAWDVAIAQLRIAKQNSFNHMTRLNALGREQERSAQALDALLEDLCKKQ